jgi:uncharacterized protein (TIGR03437 family)
MRKSTLLCNLFLFCVLPLCSEPSTQPLLSLSSASAPAGSPVSLAFSLASGGSQDAGLQWTFSYPAASVTGFSVTAGPALTAAGKTLYCSGAATAYTCLAVGTNQTGIADGIVANVSVTLASGAGSALINASNTMGVDGNGSSMSLTGAAGSASALVTAPSVTVTGLSCATTSPAGSSTTSCTVTLSGAAPSGGATVSLSSTLSTALSTPATVTVPAGSNSTTFTATAGAPLTDQIVVLTAKLNTSVQILSMNVVANPAITSLQCASTSLAAAAGTTCTVTISKAAPKTGASVTLAANPGTALVIPALVGVASGSTTATFQAVGGAVTTDQSATLSASLNGTQSVTISVIAPIVPTALKCGVTTLTSNGSTTCTVTISKNAPAGGAAVTLSTSAPTSLTVPASVTVPAATNSAGFTISAKTISASSTVSLGAAAGGTTVSISMSLGSGAAALSQLTCSPLSVTPGKGGTCTVTLTSASHPAATVTLKSTNTAFIVPASMTVPANTLSANFDYRSTTTLTGWAILSATMDTITKTASFTVVVTHSVGAGSAVGKSASLMCSPRQLAAGSSAVCEITVDTTDEGGDDSGPANFAISSSSLHVKTPVNAGGRSGRNRIRFAVTADDNAVQDEVTIEAREGDTSAQTSLTVVPGNAPHLSVAGSRVAKRGSNLRLTASAADGRDLPVTLAAIGLPESASFDSATGVFEWTPQAGDPDSATLVFTATNSLGATASETVSVYVNNGKPLIVGIENGAGAGASGACSPGALMRLSGASLTSDSDSTSVLVNGSPARVVEASAERVAFVCPKAAPGTPLTFAVQVGSASSNEMSGVMSDSSPGLLSLDGSGAGQGVAMHTRGLAALPRFGVAGMPAASGEALTLFATGINCGENSVGGLPLLYFGHDYVRVTAARANALAGVCELQAVVPAGVSGDAVPVLLESVRGDGTVARSNIISVAVE